MKKLFFYSILATLAFTLTYCGASKKSAAGVAKVNFESNVLGIMQSTCAPCHIPSKGGKKAPLDTYASVSKHIDDILRRVQLNPTDRGFMPHDNPKLSDEAINTLKQWKSDGLIEK